MLNKNGQDFQLNARILKYWPFAGWDLLAAVFFAAAVGFVVLTYTRSGTAAFSHGRALKEDPRPVSDGPVSADRPWVPFDAYAPFFTSRDIFTSSEEKAQISAQQAAGRVDPDPAIRWGDGYQLAGVMVDADPRVVVKSSNPPEIITLAVGEKLGGAVLVRVNANQAVFEYQKQLFTLVLDPKTAP